MVVVFVLVVDEEDDLVSRRGDRLRLRERVLLRLRRRRSRSRSRSRSRRRAGERSLGVRLLAWLLADALPGVVVEVAATEEEAVEDADEGMEAPAWEVGKDRAGSPLVVGSGSGLDVGVGGASSSDIISTS